MEVGAYLARPFGTLSELTRIHASQRPGHPALVDKDEVLSYGELQGRVDRLARALADGGVGFGDVAAICASTSINYAVAFLGVLEAGAIVAPLAPSSSAQSLADMLKDCGAKILFCDQPVAEKLGPYPLSPAVQSIMLDNGWAGIAFDTWLPAMGRAGGTSAVTPEHPFNIIYSSGTTGTPKGIVQPHSFRWGQFRRGIYTASAVTMISTPLYSNTTLVSFLPTLAAGGTLILMPKFEAGAFLSLSERWRATHAMLVPVQYRRLMQHPGFDGYDLSSLRYKFSTSAPFAAELKAEVLRRWPGELTEFYGMTEGGGSCMLQAHAHPDKLGTVGQPMPGHDVRLIDETGCEVKTGELGEVVGRSSSMMNGYHNQPQKTREAEWYSADGERFIRTGDIGRFDADGFLTLVDRRKDMIISGGFNIYPSDLEAELVRHPAVVEAAVLGIASEAWGETPVAAVVLRADQPIEAEALRGWVNARLGKTQRISDLRIVDALPRSPIGKVLKREIRATFAS